MQCNHCGAINHEEATFCVTCGQRLSPMGEVPQPGGISPGEQPAGVEPVTAQPVEQKRRKIPWLAIALGGLALLCLAGASVAAYFIFRDTSSTIAYVVNLSGEFDRGLYLMDADGENDRVLVSIDDNEDIGYFAWSPNGKSIAYSVMENSGMEYSLWVVEVATGETRQIVGDIEGGRYCLFDWSPDSRQIVYTVNEEQLRIVNADGSEDTALTDGIYPFWSPDGDSISFTHSSLEGASIINPDGSALITLREDPNRINVPWGWSPDNKWILLHFEIGDGSMDLYLVSRDGQEQIALVNNPDVSEQFPVFSPNGRWIAYISMDRDKDAGEIYIVRPDGSDARRVATDAYEETFISWSPDSKALVYVSNTDEAMRVELDSGEASVLIEAAQRSDYPTYAP